MMIMTANMLAHNTMHDDDNADAHSFTMLQRFRPKQQPLHDFLPDVQCSLEPTEEQVPDVDDDEVDDDDDDDKSSLIMIMMCFPTSR